MQNLSQFFSFLNDIDFLYVVLRNFENLPYSVSSGGHGDLDLLVYDLKHFKEIFPESVPVFPAPRVMHQMTIGGVNVYMDVRYVGDGYYPIDFERTLLETREYNPKGFYTSDPLHHRLGLVYHAVHHKGENTYQKHISPASIPELLEALKKSNIGYSEPLDPSVGRFNQYWRGSTAIVENQDGRVVKRQTGFKEFSLITNEKRILDVLNSRHFPKILETVEDEIIMENCGERLSIDNLPSDWKEQLIGILSDLKRYKVQHRDIKPDNLLVKDGNIFLVDFGWARLLTDEPDNPPSCLGFPYKCSEGFSDQFSMRKIIKEIEYKFEEEWV